MKQWYSLYVSLYSYDFFCWEATYLISLCWVFLGGITGIILWMRPASERWCYFVMLSLIAWMHTQNVFWDHGEGLGSPVYRTVVHWGYCFVLIMSSVLRGLYDLFTHILQGWFIGSGPVYLKDIGKMDCQLTATKYNKTTIIGSYNGLSPGQCQAIIWTNAGILLIWTLGTNFSEILSEINTFSFKEMHLHMLSEKRRPFSQPQCVN